MTGAPKVIVNVTTKLPLPVALNAVTVTEVVPGVVGVPEITPVLVFNVSPSGSAVELKLVGKLVAVMV